MNLLTLNAKIALLRARFLEQLPGRIKEARQQFEVLLENPENRVAAADLHRSLHSIMGTGQTFGFEELGTALRQVEDITKRMLDIPKTLPPPFWQELLEVCLMEIERLAHRLLAETPVSTENKSVPENPPPSTETGGKVGQQARMLYLCDDEPLVLEQLAIQLGCFGFETKTFVETKLLCDAVRQGTPDAIIMDIGFPLGQESGTEALFALNQELGKTLPIIFLSARNDFSARLQAVLAGGAAYFVKPARAPEIVATLDTLTEKETPAPYRILIVDDDSESAAFHSLVLESAGMLTCSTADPETAVEQLLEFRPDMVLLDMYMPLCSGLDLAKVIRQMPDFLGLPIVYLSREHDKKKQLSAMKVGAEGFLTKPIQPDELISAVALRAERMRSLRALMTRDSLTGLFNHSSITHFLENAINTAERQKAPLCFAMIDLDLFKSINDTYGHSAGDQVILAVARVLMQRLRTSDIVGRFGGEEFAVIVQSVSIVKAEKIFNELREDFSRIIFTGKNAEFSCTFSVGLASYPEQKTLESLRDAADRALYQAKQSGRNKVCVDPASRKEKSNG